MDEKSHGVWALVRCTGREQGTHFSDAEMQTQGDEEPGRNYTGAKHSLQLRAGSSLPSTQMSFTARTPHGARGRGPALSPRTARNLVQRKWKWGSSHAGSSRCPRCSCPATTNSPRALLQGRIPHTPASFSQPCSLASCRALVSCPGYGGSQVCAQGR